MLTFVLGTRPEIVKMSPIIRQCEEKRIDHYILHTGQHYSYEMDRSFFDQLELRDPDLNLDVGSGDHGEQSARILSGVEKALQADRPDEVLVQGDTNTVMAASLAAVKLHIRVGHVEAGLRSFDRTMPEEINRIVADHVSTHLFAPTERSRVNLLKEGIPQERILVTGNTIVDSLAQNLEIARRRVDPLRELELEDGNYILMTSHRAENVDVKDRFKGILEGAKRLNVETGLRVVFPIHPRSRKFLAVHGLDPGPIELIDPLGFNEFLVMESKASLVLTDSGGVQEETCILGTPCVTLRDNTERPETLEVGSNVLAGCDPERIVSSAKMIIGRTGWTNPFGDGRSSERIVEACLG